MAFTRGGQLRSGVGVDAGFESCLVWSWSGVVSCSVLPTPIQLRYISFVAHYWSQKAVRDDRRIRKAALSLHPVARAKRCASSFAYVCRMEKRQERVDDEKKMKK